MLSEAIRFAIEAHQGQKRKYDWTAYIKHPLSVMGMLTEFTTDPMSLSAAVLHDTVEDCQDVTLEVIHERFGEVVAGYVFYTTEKSRKEDGPMEFRKAIDREHYAKGSQVSQTIKVLDMIDNIPGICYNNPRHGEVYIKEKLALLDYLTKAEISAKVKAINLINRYREESKT